MWLLPPLALHLLVIPLCFQLISVALGPEFCSSWRVRRAWVYTVPETSLQYSLHVPNTPWQAFKMALVVPAFNIPLDIRCSPTPCQTEFVCEAYFGTAEYGALLVAPWALGGEGALAPSRRTPHGLDQTREKCTCLLFF